MELCLAWLIDDLEVLDAGKVVAGAGMSGQEEQQQY